MGAQIISGQPFTEVEVNTAGAVALNLNSRATMFVSSAVIAAAKAITIGGSTNRYNEFRWRFNVTVLPAPLTWPATVKMADPQFNDVTNEWTPADLGEYEAHGRYDGTNWYVTITGLFV